MLREIDMKLPTTVAGAMAILLVAGSSSVLSDRMEDGRGAYAEACARCHDTGVGGAPVTRNKEDWVDRSGLWEAVMSEHANEGYLGMPARGGNARMSEYDVDAAAEYMLTITHPEMPRD
jgi:cytochrome c5